jgi:biopolymer transport protein ExbD
VPLALRADLVGLLDHAAESVKDRPIFLRADRGVPYGELMDVMEIMSTGGYKLVTLESVPRRSASSQPNH